MFRLKSPLLSKVAAAQAQVLDPCTLGRAFHMLEDFRFRLGKDISRYLQDRYNQRYGSTFDVAQVQVCALGAAANATGWRYFQSAPGGMAVRMQRDILLALFAFHFGEKISTQVLVQDTPETETEQRFAVMTQQNFLEVFMQTAGCEGKPEVPSSTANSGVTTLRPSDCVLRVQLCETHTQITGLLEFVLDDAWLAYVLSKTMPARRSSTSGEKVPEKPLVQRLPVTLYAQMLDKEMYLDDVMKLHPGDILPVRVPEAVDVLVDGVPLYRAVVMERGNVLCLTDFEEVD